MTSKIFRSMILVEIVILVISVGTVIFSVSREFEARMLQDLRTQAALVSEGVRFAGVSYLEQVGPEKRMTWIAGDGQVLYDSYGAAGNHADRGEVAEAMAQGEAVAERFSETMGSECIYYALRLEDGSVLRLCGEKSAARILLFAMSRYVVWVLVLMIYGSLFVALRLSRHIVKPLESMSLDTFHGDEVYPELRPLAEQLREQKHIIGTQMDELRVREREFAAITENMREGFVLFDGRGRIISYNHSGGIILDPVEAETGRLVIGSDFSQLQTAVNSALLGEHWEGTLEYNHRVYQCLVNTVVSGGYIMGVVLFMMDATEKQMREQLRREFSANVSHELKTPLTSISGFAELMMNGMIPANKMQECAEDIYKQSQQLINLVGDIIQLSHLDEERPVTMERVDLYSVACQVQERLRDAARRQKVAMELQGQPCAVEGIPHIVDEMVYNLCDNAIKYNVPGGRVNISITSGEGKAVVTVADTGIGIPTEEQERVFERFYRVNKSHSKEIGGTGLGLSIVKHGAQLHGAEMNMVSAPGKGTTVQIIFKKSAAL